MPELPAELLAEAPTAGATFGAPGVAAFDWAGAAGFAEAIGRGAFADAVVPVSGRRRTTFAGNALILAVP
jgi:hypothetical protein